MARIGGQTVERVALGRRELYVHYGQNMGSSKLELPTVTKGTARNLNTVTKRVELSAAEP